MSLFAASLNSGSNGNCYYIGNEHEAVLIDAGLSCRETETRMKRLGLNIRKVKAVFISHEHSDHIRGLEVLSKKYRLPVYVTSTTLRHGGLVLDEELVMDFIADKPIPIGNLVITPFSKIHDAAHPHSFTIACDTIKIGVFTDIGMVCENLVNHFQQCHAAFLEANYEEELLEKGRYPLHLKRRISGRWGHLSNKQALVLFTDYRPSFMTHLFLSHLSKDNNDPALVHNLFYNQSRGTEIIIASRYHETPVYHINKNAGATTSSGYVQASLF